MKWMMTLALAAALAGSAHAQDKDRTGFNVPEAAQRLTARMTEELGLSTDQAAQVQALNEKYLRKTMVSREEAAGETGKPDKQAILAESERDLKGVLTARQFEKMQQMQGARPARTPEGKPINEVAPVR